MYPPAVYQIPSHLGMPDQTYTLVCHDSNLTPSGSFCSATFGQHGC